MASLNIMCAICSEFYKNTDTVYSTTACGHLFHQQCLFRWLHRANTCPQCRRPCFRTRIHRVFLNFGERTEVDDEIDAITASLPFWAPLDERIGDGPQAVPEGGIKSGTDADGNDIYVARAYYNEDLLPANYVPKKGGAFVSHGCHAHFLTTDVEVLLDCKCEWVADSQGRVPENAIVVGYSETGEDLYTGRGQYEGITLPGKVHRSHGVLYMPYNKQEVNVKEYEVLVRSPEQQEAK